MEQINKDAFQCNMRVLTCMPWTHKVLQQF